jgi:hypothetical protein
MGATLADPERAGAALAFPFGEQETCRRSLPGFREAAWTGQAFLHGRHDGWQKSIGMTTLYWLIITCADTTVASHVEADDPTLE